MKVTFCAFDGHNCINGINAWLLRLLPSLRDRGIESQILFITWAPDEQCTVLPVFRQMGFECHVAPLPYYTESHTRWILKILAANPPDVFVPHYMVPAFYAARWVKGAGIPTIGILHNDDAEYRAIQHQFVFGQSADQLSAIVGVSKVLEDQVHARQPGNTIVKRIPCGVPLPQQSSQPAKHSFRLIYVGRLTEEQKRISDVTRALCRAVREVPGTEAFIYGSGPAQPEVEGILEQEGQGLPIYLAGFANNETIQANLLNSQALVLLSDYEGLPVAVMEAMACGVVPICLRIQSGIPELVEDGVNGLLVSDRGDDFVNAVRRLQQDTELWHRLSHGARETIKTGYAHEVCVDAWEKLLRELNAQAQERKPIHIPWRIALPKVHPGLTSNDPRKPAFYQTTLWNSRKMAGRVKQQVLHSFRSSPVQ